MSLTSESSSLCTALQAGPDVQLNLFFFDFIFFQFTQFVKLGGREQLFLYNSL